MRNSIRETYRILMKTLFHACHMLCRLHTIRSINRGFCKRRKRAPHGNEQSGWGSTLPYCYVSSFLPFSNFAFSSDFCRLFFVISFSKSCSLSFQTSDTLCLPTSAQGTARESQNSQKLGQFFSWANICLFFIYFIFLKAKIII